MARLNFGHGGKVHGCNPSVQRYQCMKEAKVVLMATSGSRDFNLDVGEIIEEAYERCGLEVRTGYDAKTARRSLNLMFADWANRGLNLWTVKEANVYRHTRHLFLFVSSRYS